MNKLTDLISQNHVFQKALASLDRKNFASFSGIVGSSAAAVISSLKQARPNILVITSSSQEALALKNEVEFFSKSKAWLFPAPDTVAGEEFAPAKEIIGERLTILSNWQQGANGVVVAPVKAVMWRTGRALKDIRLSGDQVIRIDELIEKLINFGYRRFDVVGERGEFSVRGGIVDVFPLNSANPMRIELMGDEIESIRLFDVYSQRSINKLDKIAILPAHEPYEVPVFDYLPKDCLVVLLEKMELARAADRHIEEQASFSASVKYLTLDQIMQHSKKRKLAEFSAFVRPESEAIFSAPQTYLHKLPEIPKEAIIVSKHASRLVDEIPAQVIEGHLRGGFVIDGRQILTDKELFGEEVVIRQKKTAVNEGVADELLADLKVGDYVVHENYGIGIYGGMATLEIEGLMREYLLIEYDKGDKVYVPPSLAGMVEKFSSGGDYRPKLSRLGTKQWIKIKGRVKKALRDMTKELLSLYAVRQKVPGVSFSKDDMWQRELEATFPFEETVDQKKAISETKQDMESTRSMDRLVCGDVGYGKTEVAIRAAAKAVSSGKQVAILVPTTILAEQHYNNFKNRFRSSPYIIEMLSRFRSKKEQMGAVKALATGGVDIVIGTHRLFSKDIAFHDLGLLIVDEEQRFGVAHKEKLKKLKKNVDVLTLSATPIPRTLYLSLSGARDLSVINTPPVDRSPIRTYVLPWSEKVVREAVLREIDRGGQVYFVHNIVETIEGVASKIKKLVPEAKIAVGHGQMPEKKLEKTMFDFMGRKFDVLVCTSIIESGLDIPNVNTILIDYADRFGLSQLYQIRGRVGRSAVRAYAYLFYYPEKNMTDQALERLKAIQEFTALGSGYKLAMRDLEIRGAGNLLGAEQSGHIMEVGFDLYCELLEEAVREVKGIKEVTPREVLVDLKVEAFIPEDYITDERQRIAVYRRMNLLAAMKDVAEMKQELIDRFGMIPPKLEKLLALLKLKVKAMEKNILSIKEENNKIYIDWVSGKRRKLEIKGEDKIKLVEQYIAG
ncbi:MAG: transcription-repair coupling factor [Candidatus Margulisbacteria bacterium]|nr:transcription-repair coupling factor [Candidatus Margulisiibacteriota bacterium]